MCGSFEGAYQFDGGLPASRRIRLQTAAHDFLERLRRNGFTVRGRARAGQHFIEDAAERIDVGADIRGFAFALFRRHIGRRADHHAAAGERVVSFPGRQSEVENLDAGLDEHDVAGLEIAVNDPMFVRLGQGGGDLRGVAERLVERQRAILQPGGDRVALEQFHHQVVGADVVKRADVGVIQRRNRARLALEAGAELLVGELDGDGAAEARVDGAKDFAHAALAELAFDLVWSQASARGQFGEVKSSSSCGAFWMAGRSRNSPPVRVQEATPLRGAIRDLPAPAVPRARSAVPSRAAWYSSSICRKRSGVMSGPTVSYSMA